MRNRLILGLLAGLAALLVWPAPAHAMHISEGVLQPGWCGIWFAVAAPFVIWGVLTIRARRRRQSSYMPMLAMVGAAVFLISCMPIPVPVAGSCSHPCGTGLAAILVGPAPTVVIAAIALLFQALFLSHGGLTTLGANICSMGILGALVGFGAFRVVRKATGSTLAGCFAAGLLSDWATYAGTSFMLAAALHRDGSIWAMFGSIATAFIPTQLPLGILEGILTAIAYSFVFRRRPELLGAVSVQAAAPAPVVGSSAASAIRRGIVIVLCVGAMGATTCMAATSSSDGAESVSGAAATSCPSAVGQAPAVGAGESEAKNSEATPGTWEGVDDTVVGRYAKEAGRPPSRSFIDTDKGDLLLFVFLLAGIVGGFVMGYHYRALFGKKAQGQASAEGGRDACEGQANAPGA
jgi:cobalt/nickel transport system permease protein